MGERSLVEEAQASKSNEAGLQLWNDAYEQRMRASSGAPWAMYAQANLVAGHDIAEGSSA